MDNIRFSRNRIVNFDTTHLWASWSHEIWRSPTFSIKLLDGFCRRQVSKFYVVSENQFIGAAHLRLLKKKISDRLDFGLKVTRIAPALLLIFRLPLVSSYINFLHAGR